MRKKPSAPSRFAMAACPSSIYKSYSRPPRLDSERDCRTHRQLRTYVETLAIRLPNRRLLLPALCLERNAKGHRRNVVLLSRCARKRFGSLEKMVERFIRGFLRAPAPKFAQPVPSEILVPIIPEFVQPVGGKQNGISRLQPHHVLIVGRSRKHAGWNTALPEYPATLLGHEHRVGKPRVRKCQLTRHWIEERVNRRAVAPRYRPHQQPFVQKRQHRRRVFARLVNSSKRAHHQRCIHCRRESFAHHIAHVQADQPVGQMEKIRKIPSHIGEW